MERAWFMRCLFVLLLLAVGVPAQAAEHEKPDMFKLALDLGLWTIVVFLILMFVLRKYAWDPMLEGLHKREHNIQLAIEEAKKAHEEALKLREQLQREMDKAAEKVREIMDEARRDAQRTTEEMIAKARAEIQAERDRLRREIKTAQDQAIQELWSQTAQLAARLSSKVIQRQLSTEDHRKLIDETLKEMEGNGAGGRKK